MDNLKEVEGWLDHTKSISDFRLSIRAAVRGLWNGEFTAFTFVDSMRAAIERNLRKAWNEGAADCGIQADELSDKEISAREELINSQFSYLIGFARDIEENSRASKGLLGPHLDRAERWIAQYDKAFRNGKAMACGDRKARFVLGPTEKHCRTCSGLNGRVYRYSTWVANNAVPPRNARFECGGASRCDCRLEDTTEPITKGSFPKGLLV